MQIRCFVLGPMVLVSLGFALPPAAGAAETSPVVVRPLPDHRQPVVARCDADGAIHLVCDSPEGPVYLKSTDNGRTFAEPLAVVDRASRKPGLEFTAWDLAVSPAGHVHVALGTNAWKLKLPKEEWGFYYARLEPGADGFSPVKNINRKPSEGYSLAADEQGNVTACWLSDKLYANVSHDNGETFGENLEIDPAFNPCNCCTTACTYGPGGKLAILYREETDNLRDMYLVLWDQEHNQSSRVRVGRESWQTDACPMTYYSIAAAADGFVAAWPTRGEISFARLAADGAMRTDAEIKTPGKCGHRTGVLTLNDPAGDTLVVWKKDGQLGWQLYNSLGRPLGRAGSAKSAGNGAAGVVTKEGAFVLFR